MNQAVYRSENKKTQPIKYTMILFSLLKYQ